MSPKTTDESLVSLTDAAESLGLSSSTLRHQIRNGRFNAWKLGRDWVTTVAEVKRYRREHKMDDEIADKHRHRSRKSPDEEVASTRNPKVR